MMFNRIPMPDEVNTTPPADPPKEFDPYLNKDKSIVPNAHDDSFMNGVYHDDDLDEDAEDLFADPDEA